MKVCTEALQRLGVQITIGHATATRPAHKMLGSSNVPASSYLRVAALMQPLSETFDQITAWTTTNCVYPSPRSEVLR
jgi:hypothetical protein